jgi:hypothetical protein
MYRWRSRMPESRPSRARLWEERLQPVYGTDCDDSHKIITLYVVNADHNVIQARQTGRSAFHRHGGSRTLRPWCDFSELMTVLSLNGAERPLCAVLAIGARPRITCTFRPGWASPAGGAVVIRRGCLGRVARERVTKLTLMDWPGSKRFRRAWRCCCGLWCHRASWCARLPEEPGKFQAPGKIRCTIVRLFLPKARIFPGNS